MSLRDSTTLKSVLPPRQRSEELGFWLHESEQGPSLISMYRLGPVVHG